MASAVNFDHAASLTFWVLWLQPDDSMSVLKIGYCIPPSGMSAAKAQTGLVQAWSQNQLPAPLAFFPLAADLNSSTLPRYVGMNQAAAFLGDASFGQVLSCDKVRACKA